MKSAANISYESGQESTITTDEWCNKLLEHVVRSLKCDCLIFPVVYPLFSSTIGTSEGGKGCRGALSPGAGGTCRGYHGLAAG